jgi:hypothetical protein
LWYQLQQPHLVLHTTVTMVVGTGTVAGTMAGAGAMIIGIIIDGMAITIQTVTGY